MSRVCFPLYHGTSTLFLESIAKHGLGGINPIQQLRVVECARRMLPLAKSHSEKSKVLASRLTTFELMAEQVSGNLNFQHGQAYVTPSLGKAVAYACHKRRGSELITYALDVAEELIRLDVGVIDDVAKEFPDLFALLDIASAPVLITLADVDDACLLSEGGHSADENLDFVRECIAQDPDSYQEICQQHNFRLSAPIPPPCLKVSLILARRYEYVPSQYSTLELDITKLAQ